MVICRWSDPNIEEKSVILNGRSGDLVIIAVKVDEGCCECDRFELWFICKEEDSVSDVRFVCLGMDGRKHNKETV